MQALKAAFETENRIHPRETIQASLTSAICRARASWLLEDVANSAVFPAGPEWTILQGQGPEIPQPTAGQDSDRPGSERACSRRLRKLDGNVQTLGLAMADPEREAALASVAASRGVDRIVQLGRMHVFSPPWDGVDLIRIMVRMVRHVRSGRVSAMEE